MKPEEMGVSGPNGRTQYIACHYGVKELQCYSVLLPDPPAEPAQGVQIVSQPALGLPVGFGDGVKVTAGMSPA